MPRSPVGASTGDMRSTWGGAAGEIRCGRCGTVLKGSERHTCAIVQQRTPKVETSPLAQPPQEQRQLAAAGTWRSSTARSA